MRDHAPSAAIHTRRPALLLALLVPLAPVAAAARPHVLTQAQEEVNAAEAAFKEGRYAAALSGFQQAEKTLLRADRKVPSVLYRSIARCYEMLARDSEALAYYEQFLEDGSKDNPRLAAIVRQAEDARSRLRARFFRTSLTFSVLPRSARLEVDGKGVGTVPDEPLPITPGVHRVVLSAPGHWSATIDVDAPAGARVPVTVWLRPAGGAGMAGETLPGSGPLDQTLTWAVTDGAPWASGGLGLLAAGAATGAALLYARATGLTREADGLALGAYTPADAALAQQAVDVRYARASSRRSAAAGLALTALASAATAAWLWSRSGDGERAEEAVGRPGGEDTVAIRPPAGDLTPARHGGDR